jgi:hypothetical protein
VAIVAHDTIVYIALIGLSSQNKMADVLFLGFVSRISFVTRLTRRVPQVQQELFTLPEFTPRV